MKGTPALICIPDISGFTEFMSEADLAKSSKIIPALLNKIIDSNTIGLKISEIEGDAILFYKTGVIPSLQDIIAQCRSFHIRFHEELDALRGRSGLDPFIKELVDILGIKIILHYGSINAVEVGFHIKLMGEDIIIAHRLLKNSIQEAEYVLISDELIGKYISEKKNPSGLKGFVRGEMNYEYLGKLTYHYKTLKKRQMVK